MNHEENAKQFLSGLQPTWNDVRYLQYAHTLSTKCTIVTITGKAGVGKDVLARVLNNKLVNSEILPFNWYFFLSFAHLKGLEVSEYEHFKRAVVGYAKDGTSIKGRDMLIAFGDFMEASYGVNNVCVDYARYALRMAPTTLINSSVRRKWEYDFLNQAGALNVHINSVCENSDTIPEANQQHVTEDTAIYSRHADIVISNNYTLDSAGKKVYNAPIHLDSTVNKIVEEVKRRNKALADGLLPTRK